MTTYAVNKILSDVKLTLLLGEEMKQIANHEYTLEFRKLAVKRVTPSTVDKESCASSSNLA